MRSDACLAFGCLRPSDRPSSNLIRFCEPTEQAASICDRDRWLASNLILSRPKMLWKIAMNPIGNLHGRAACEDSNMAPQIATLVRFHHSSSDLSRLV